MALLADRDAPPATSNSRSAMPVFPAQKQVPDERRAAYRFPVVGARGAGRLRIGPREIAVEILDESAGGFSAVSDETLAREVGQTLLLGVDSNWMEVRVMNLQPQGSRTRLGLARLRDIDATEIEAAPAQRFSMTSIRKLMAAIAPVSGPVGRGVALVAAAFFAGVIVYFVLERSAPVVEVVHNDEPVKQSRKIVQVNRPLLPPTATTTTTRDKRPVARIPLAPLPIAPVGAKPPRLALAQEPSNDVIRRSQPEFLLKPDVAKLLALTREQLDELQRIFDESRSAASEAIVGVQLSLQERELQLGRLVLAVLTEKQRSDLMRLLSVSDSLNDTQPAIQPQVAPDDK
jgi:hypothetical protein